MARGWLEVSRWGQNHDLRKREGRVIPRVLLATMGVSALVMAALAVWVWRKGEPGMSRPFALSMACSAAWALFYGLDVMSETIPGKILQIQFRNTFVSLLGPAWYLWVRRFARPDQPLGRWGRLLLWGYPLLQAPFLWTMPRHALYLTDLSLRPAAGWVLLQYRLGPAQMGFLAWAYLIHLATLWELGRMVVTSRHSFDVHRSLIMLVSTFVPGLVNGLFLVGITPIADFNLAPCLLLFSGLINAWAVFRYHLADLLPFARATLFTHLTDGLLVFDQKGRLVDLNLAAQQLLGLDPLRDVGRPPAMFLARLPEAVAFLERVMTSDRMRAELSVPPGQQPVDARPTTPPGRQGDGSTGMAVISPGETILEFTSHRMVARGGNPNGAIVLIRDVSEHHRLEAELRRSEARARMLLEAAPFPVVVTDLESQIIVYANPKALAWVGLPAETVIGRPVAQFYQSPEEREGILRDLKAQGQIESREVPLWRGDGRPATVLMSVCPITYEGRRSAYVAFSDITGYAALQAERRRLEGERRELEASEQERRRIGMELHDGLGQVLSGLLMVCRAMEERMTAAEISAFPEVRILRERLGQSVRSARLLAHGLNPVELSGEALHRALEETAEQIRSIWRIDCRLEPAEPVRVEPPATALQLLRIAQEALHNAVRHGTPRVIAIRLQAVPPAGCLEINDDGCGFAMDQAGGRGRGLETMRFRAQQIEGELQVSSRPGRGTTVVCRFPCR